MKVLPLPGAISTSIVPPWRFTIPHATDSPRPVRCGPLVVKNGAKIRSRVRSDIPWPLS